MNNLPDFTKYYCGDAFPTIRDLIFILIISFLSLLIFIILNIKSKNIKDKSTMDILDKRIINREIKENKYEKKKRKINSDKDNKL